MMNILKGKVAIVTGAGRGHAEALAVVFAKEGANVSLCDIIPVDTLEQRVGARIRENGSRVLCSQTDVANEQQVSALIHRTIAEFGTVDILANSVGIAGPTKDIWEITLDEWRHTLAVNLDSMFLCTKAVLPEMMRKQWGRIINFSSGTGKTPLAHRTPYATTKMGVIGFTRTLAVDVGRFNITANAICPGYSGERNVELARDLAKYRGIPFNADAYRQQLVEQRRGSVLAGRWIAREGYSHKGSLPMDVARLALFLASDDAALITGQDINVTGGGVMW
jgi:NAD(P)-dependent dehydrogenase (short-subunit alcohol dehydrogenase family)